MLGPPTSIFGPMAMFTVNMPSSARFFCPAVMVDCPELLPNRGVPSSRSLNMAVLDVPSVTPSTPKVTSRPLSFIPGPVRPRGSPCMGTITPSQEPIEGGP